MGLWGNKCRNSPAQLHDRRVNPMIDAAPGFGFGQ
jgi:hypothetical protein